MGALFLFKTTSPFKDLGFYIGQMQLRNHGENVVFTGYSFEKNVIFSKNMNILEEVIFLLELKNMINKCVIYKQEPKDF